MHPDAPWLRRQAIVQAKALGHVDQIARLLQAPAAKFAAQQGLQGAHHDAVGPQRQAFCPGQVHPHQDRGAWSNNCW